MADIANEANGQED